MIESSALATLPNVSDLRESFQGFVDYLEPDREPLVRDGTMLTWVIDVVREPMKEPQIGYTL